MSYFRILLQTLEENMRDGVVSNSLVAFLRMLTSCEIELKSDFFAPFIMVRSSFTGPICHADGIAVGNGFGGKTAIRPGLQVAFSSVACQQRLRTGSAGHCLS